MIGKRSAPVRPSDEEAARQFLGREYNALIDLYIHHENGITAIFNFYLTLLSTIGGATIVLVQVGKPTLSSFLPTIAALLLFAMLLGVVVQEAMLNKAVDLAQVTRSINLLKYEALKARPELQQYIDYLYNPFARLVPLTGSKDWLDRMGNRFWYLKWVGSHQLFVGIFNSLALGGLFLCLVKLLSLQDLPAWKLILASLVVSVVTLYTHAIYANLEFRRRSKTRQLRMSIYQQPPQD